MKRPPSFGNEDWCGVVREYEIAYVNRDINRLGQVWKFTPYQRESMSRFFKEVKELRVEVSVVGARQEGSTIEVDFIQSIVSRGGRVTARFKEHRLTAVLIERSGRWIISSIRGIRGG